MPVLEGAPPWPLVTVVVPVFNGSRYLGESLDSILGQTYPNLEVLVFDDASTDDTPAVIAAYQDRVRCCRQPQNRGIYDNANDGIAAAAGEFIAIYHADDVYKPTMVEREVDFLLHHPEVGAVFCADVFIDAEGREYARLQLPPEVRGGRPLGFPIVLNALLKYKNAFLVCPSAMVRASTYREVGTYRQAQFRNTSDLDMWLRISRHCAIGVLEEHLLNYRHFHGSSAQRYHHLRTAPERFFEIMDLHLTDGARAVATPEAVAAFETHRAVDRLKNVISHYILGQLHEGRTALKTVDAWLLGYGFTLRRLQIFGMFLALQVLCRLPRVSFVADAFYRRWYVKRPPAVPNLPPRP